MASDILNSRGWFYRPRQGAAGTGSTSVQVLQRQRERSHTNRVESRFGFGTLIKRKRVLSTLRLRCCRNEGTKAVEEEEDDDNKFMKMTREVQPYVRAHQDSTLVVILSAEIVDSPYLSSILEVTHS